MAIIQHGASSGSISFVCETQKFLTTPPEQPKAVVNPLHAKPMGMHWYPGWGPQPNHPFGPPWSTYGPWWWKDQAAGAYLDREPLQGWYNEQDRATVGHQLIMMAEYGVDFVCVNWFYHANTKTFFMEEALQAMMELPHNPVKFCIGFDPQTSPMPVRNRDDLDICIARWKTIIAHPNYFRYSGKPVLFFGKMEQMVSDIAANSKLSHKDLISYIRTDLGQDVYIIGGGQALSFWTNQAFVAGYDAYCPYNMFFAFTNHDAGVPGPAPTTYAEMAANHVLEWQWYISNLKVDFWLPLTAGFDGSPWGKDKIGMANPTELAAHFASSLPYLADPKVKGGLLYAWNEIGEGGIMIPTKLHGRQKLEKFKSVFRT